MSTSPIPGTEARSQAPRRLSYLDHPVHGIKCVVNTLKPYLGDRGAGRLNWVYIVIKANGGLDFHYHNPFERYSSIGILKFRDQRNREKFKNSRKL